MSTAGPTADVLHPFLDGLIDDAGLFPPASLSMSNALAGHLRHRGGPFAPLVGRFLCPASRLEELIASLDGALGPNGDLRLGLIVDRGIESIAPALALLVGEPRLVLESAEVSLPPGVPDLAAAARDATAALPDIEGYVELPRIAGWRHALSVLTDSPYGAKLRTGGASGEAFPSEAEVADFIESCVAAEVPYKCTAGLHNAVRHRDPTTGFEHHGFLNVLLSTDAAVRGDGPEQLQRLLASQDGPRLAQQFRSIEPSRAAIARSFFVSYGSCSIDEPIDDLLALGILQKRLTALSGWLEIPPDSDFPVESLPYGAFSRGLEPPRIGVAIGDSVLDVSEVVPEPAFREPVLNAFMAQGRPTWQSTRDQLTDMLTDERHRGRIEPHMLPRNSVRLHLPFEVGDYVDFYSSLHHAENVGRIFRPDTDPLTPNWKHLPIGYHGRAGTVVISGTDVVRPCGQRKKPAEIAPTFGPSERLDIEAEVGFVVGVRSALGAPVPLADFREHVFGAVLLNDWSARDIQAWEYVPLGPFLGKSFATSISPWVVTLDALEAARVPPPSQAPAPLPYLRDGAHWGYDIGLEVTWNGHVVSRPPFRLMYWTAAQQLAHLTVNGASLRTGDLFASGTVSGPERDQRGSFLELTWSGTDPVEFPDGSTRTFLADDDTVSITAAAPGPAGSRIGFGEVSGRIVKARS